MDMTLYFLNFMAIHILMTTQHAIFLPKNFGVFYINMQVSYISSKFQ